MKKSISGRLGKAIVWRSRPGSGTFSGAYDYLLENRCDPGSGSDRCLLDTYIEKVNGRFDTTGLKDRTYIYIPVTCLRGITWCAMAWVQYQQPDKEIFNQSTFDKLEAYLSDEF